MWALLQAHIFLKVTICYFQIKSRKINASKLEIISNPTVLPWMTLECHIKLELLAAVSAKISTTLLA